MPTVNLQPNAAAGVDTFIASSDAANDNFGVATILNAGHSTSTGRTAKALIRFDLSSIPSDAEIVSAILRLHCINEVSNADHNVSVHRGLVEWFEGDQAGGLPPSGAGSTWNHRNYQGSVGWSGGAGGAAGSDYAVSPTDTTLITGTNADFDWDVSVDVQDFVDGSATNRGWWLIAASGSDSLKIFYSSDHSVADLRPELIVTYEQIDEIAGSAHGAATVSGQLSMNLLALELQPDASAGKDTTLITNQPDTNFGTNVIMAINSMQKGLIQFDISNLPPYSAIVGASLYLVCSTPSEAPSEISIHRGLVEWFESGSTWNERNAAGDVAWLGGPGGGADDDYVDDATDSIVLDGLGVFAWDVLADVIGFYNGDYTNYGWWLISQSGGTRDLRSSDHTVASERPLLRILYRINAIAGAAEGAAVVGGTLVAIGFLAGAAEGEATVSAEIHSNQDMSGTAAGGATASAEIHSNQELSGVAAGGATATAYLYSNLDRGGTAAGEASATGTIVAVGYLAGTGAGSSTNHALMRGKGTLAPGFAAGEATVIGHLLGRYKLAGMTHGSSAAIGSVFGMGHLIGLAPGSAHAFAAGWAWARSVKVAKQRNPAPLLELTDGVDTLNLLDPRAIKVCRWRPAIAQYKGGGQWSDSPLAHGRRLVVRRFANAIEVFEFDMSGKDQDEVIAHLRRLLRFLEAAADYWTTGWAQRPVYVRARSAYEEQTRYALVHVASVPELADVLDQSFFTARGPAVMAEITLRLERGAWLEKPPGEATCVAISSIRSWTVAGWQSGGDT